MKNKLFKGAFVGPSLDLDSSFLWKKDVSKLTAKSEFCYSSVSYKGYLNLDKSMESNSVVDNSSLVSNFLDSSDWDVTQGLSVFEGKGSHVSNELENLDVFLDDSSVYDFDTDSFSYGGFSYNDLFFEDEEGEEESCDWDEDCCDEEDDCEEDNEDDCEEDDELEVEEESMSYVLSSVSNNVFFKDVNFMFLENTFNNLSDLELKALMKKELKS